MKKALLLIFAAAFLSGCASYRFQKGQPPLDKGYVASRDDFVMPEYTLGENNTAPKIKLAKERFARRKNTVEDYYKKMGYIQNNFKRVFWDPGEMFVRLVGGVFYLPVLAVKDFKYEHNPQYRAKIDRMEEEKEKQEDARIKKLKTGLAAYVQRDLEKYENAKPLPPKTAQEKPASAPEKEEPAPIKKEMPVEAKPEVPAVVPVAQKEEAPVEAKPAVIPQPPAAVPIEAQKETAPEIVQQEPARQEIAPAEVKPAAPVKQKAVKAKKPAKVKLPKEKTIKPQIKKEIRSETPKDAAVGPKAVIIARPANGYSPLKVRFSAVKSNAPRPGRIVSYSWDFGDGDTSTKPEPVNTFYSGESEPQYFTVTLTVQDDKGNTADAQATIEVLNK